MPEKKEKLLDLNITVVALVALVSLVAVTAMVLNGGMSRPSATRANEAGSATYALTPSGSNTVRTIESFHKVDGATAQWRVRSITNCMPEFVQDDHVEDCKGCFEGSNPSNCYDSVSEKCCQG